MPWYRTGTVAVTLNSKTVTGTGTGWSSISGNAIVGSAFRGPDGRVYEVQTLVNDTTITLVENYLGSTASSQAYALMPTPGIAADLATAVGNLVGSSNTLINGATTLGKGLLVAADAGVGRQLLEVEKLGGTSGDAAVNDGTKVVTSIWAKFGFAVSLGVSGYIKFPTWLGGLRLQWGSAVVTLNAGGEQAVTFPSAFASIYTVVVTSGDADASGGGTDIFSVTSNNLTSFIFRSVIGSTGARRTGTTVRVNYFALGT